MPPESPSPGFLVMTKALERPAATREHLPNLGCPVGEGAEAFSLSKVILPGHPGLAPKICGVLGTAPRPRQRGGCLVTLGARMVFRLRP